MEILLNKIYRIGSTLVRVFEISGDYATTTEYGTYNIAEYKNALIAGQKFECRSHSGVFHVAEDVEYLDDDTVIKAISGETGEIVDIPAYLNEDFNFIYISTHPEEIDMDEKRDYAPWQKEIENYISECRIPFSSNVINKIAVKARDNKSSLISVLSRHKDWNAKTLSIDTVVDVPNPSSLEDAKEIFDNIISEYQHQYPNDYRRLICVKKYMNLDTFLDIGADKAAEFKALGLHIAKGMKPSRAINKFFTETGISRISDYEKEFAKLSDYLTSNSIRRRITLSVNPMDFLRMSEGNSWKSCHLVRDHGCYSNGVFSYMMDEQSMVLSLLDPTNEEPTYLQKKINRMMFFLNENGDILQSRLYPQVRIPAIEDFLANWVNTQIAECLDIENLYRVAVTDTACINYVDSCGSHYRDYGCHDFGQRIWTHNGDSPNQFYIGHESYCVKCGDVNSRNGEIICCDCEHSSGRDSNLCFGIAYRCPNCRDLFMYKSSAKFNEADGRYYLKYYTCKDCGKIFFDKHIYCEECRENHPEIKICRECGQPIIGDATEIDGEFYCEDCVDQFFEECRDCGRLERKVDMYYIEDLEEYVCGDCFHKGEYFECYDCGNYFSNSEATHVEGVGDVCDSCLSDYYYCEDCGRYYCSDDIHYIGRYDSYVCDDCIDRNYVWCEECEEYVLAEDAEEIDGSYYCPSCVEEYAWRCDHCSELHMGSSHDVDGNILCDDCFDEQIAVCAECGHVGYIPDMVEIDGEYYCEDCVPEEESEEEEHEEETASVTTQTSPDHVIFDNGREVTLTTPIDRFDAGTVGMILSYEAASEQYIIQINTDEHTYYRSVGRDQIA